MITKRFHPILYTDPCLILTVIPIKDKWQFSTIAKSWRAYFVSVTPRAMNIHYQIIYLFIKQANWPFDKCIQLQRGRVFYIISFTPILKIHYQSKMYVNSDFRGNKFIQSQGQSEIYFGNYMPSGQTSWSQQKW